MSSPRSLRIVLHTHGRLPVGVHPATSTRLSIGGLVVSGAQHRSHHHRRRDRRPAHPRRVQLDEIVIRHDLITVIGQPLINEPLVTRCRRIRRVSSSEPCASTRPIMTPSLFAQPDRHADGQPPGRLSAGSPRPLWPQREPLRPLDGHGEILHPDEPEGHVVDLCRRMLGLATPPAPMPPVGWLASLWLAQVLAAALARPQPWS